MRNIVITKDLTNRDQLSIDKYFADICHFDLISPEDESKLMHRIRVGDREALSRLITANLRFVISVAKKYQHQGLSLADLINEGNMGLIEAAQRFDETRGFRFITYAVWWIRQSIIRAITENARMVRLPANRIHNISKINDRISRLQQQDKREPVTEEIISHLKPREKEAFDHPGDACHPISLDAPADHCREIPVSDTISNEQSLPPDDDLIRHSIRFEIKRVLKTLTQREAEVIDLHYGLENGMPMSLQSIGTHFDISEERVRQIRSNAFKKLREPAAANHLKNLLSA